MALPYAFANVAELDTPQLDADFNALGALAVIPCVAVGTNAITLTPAANTPTISAYSNNAPEFSFVAASTSTSALTLQVLGLGLKNVYKNNGATAAGANDFIAGSTYKVSYNAALNTAAGGWVILNQGASSAGSSGSVQGSHKGLKVQTTSDTTIVVMANQIAVSDGSTAFTTIFAPSLTIGTGTVGANGIDTGAISTSTWYYVYAIYNLNTSTAAGLISLSSTSPALPSGYAQFARVGAVITDGSAHLLRTLQYGRRVTYIIGTNPTATIIMSTGPQGAPGTPTWIGVAVANYIPPTASVIFGTTMNNGNALAVAPNNSYGAYGSTTNPPPVASNGASSNPVNIPFSFVLESTSIYWAAAATTALLIVTGWEDNL